MAGKDPAAQLGLPMLAGTDKPEMHLTTYQVCLQTRINKLTDARSRAEPGVANDSTGNMKKPLNLNRSISGCAIYFAHLNLLGFPADTHEDLTACANRSGSPQP